jgi:carbohydrate binding protein with CBM4/9 domain
MRNSLRTAIVAVVCVLTIAPACLGQGRADAPLECRWFFAFGHRRTRADVVKIKGLIDTAAAHGLNGMVLSSFGVDSITRWKAKDVALLKEIAAYCAEKKIELIPTGFSAGYGGGALGHDRSFAAALPTTISLKVKGRRIVPAPGKNLLVNGDLENHSRNRFKGFDWHDKPGQISFADTVAASGKTSIRFENFKSHSHGNARISQTVAVRPGRTYRLTFKIKTEAVQPLRGLKAMVYVAGRSLAEVKPKVKATQDWTSVTLEYINKDQKEIKIYAGIWNGKSGKFWLDDFRFSEYGDLADIPRRAGTPLKLKSLDRDKTFAEGKDFRAIPCLRRLQSVPLLPNSSLKDGEKLELSCYKIPGVMHSWGKQISLCMSNPKLYEYWEEQAKALHKVIKFKRFLLAMDEIRNGGGCLTCQKSGKTMAEILGECVTRQHAIFKAIDPKIEVMIWSDMLDPAHNARGNYYGVVGDYTGAWKHVPKDLTMMCWYHKIRDKSLPFFSKQGFRTFGAAYYDAKDLTGSKEWLVSLKKTPRAYGIMYTTWQKKYKLLAGFGDLVSGAGK